MSSGLSKEHKLVVTIKTAEPMSESMAKSITLSSMNHAFSMSSTIRSVGVEPYNPQSNVEKE